MHFLQIEYKRCTFGGGLKCDSNWISPAAQNRFQNGFCVGWPYISKHFQLTAFYFKSCHDYFLDFGCFN